MKKTSILLAAAMSLTACAQPGTPYSANTLADTRGSYLPETFNTTNIMAVHPGMTSTQLLKLFGTPNNVSERVCGNTHKWKCTTWEYGKFPYDRASFTFNGSSTTLTLNDFDIARVDGSTTLPDTFTTDNIMTIHQGLSADTILKTFGAPKNVSQAVCGGGTWICTTWEYGAFPYQRASFTFSSNHSSLILNDFDIVRD